MQNARLWLTLLIGVVALCIGVALGYWLFQSQEEASSPSQNTNFEAQNVNTTGSSNTNSAVNESITNTTVTYEDGGGEIIKEPTVVPSSVTPIDTPLVFVSGLVNNYVESYDTGTSALQGTQYAGQHMLLLSVRPEGPYQYPLFFRFVRLADASLVLLSLYSDDWTWQLDESKFSIDTETVVPAFDFPSILTSNVNPRYVFERDTYVNAFFSDDGLIQAFEDPKYGPVYTSAEPDDQKFFGRNGFYIRAADSTVRAYRLRVDFNNGENVPGITWLDGTKNYSQYTFSGYGGCGATNYAEVVTDDEVRMDELEQIGTSSKGDIIYGFKDPEHTMLKDLFETYSGYYPETTHTYSDFLAQHPIIFYKDPFNRLLKGQNDLYKPLAECGKPVIYLYPEEGTEVEVKVAPSGGFSKTVPEYGSGWKVFAEPDGQLTEIAAGLRYPYLFWEGRSTSIYETPSQGWVVEKAKVHDFLNETLTKFGLNAREIADFQEFWEPKMQSAPYYFITFMGNHVMNQLAPLDITPKPDTVIRVLMDYQALDERINVPSFQIRTTERKGFTVVEWGGVLH